MPCTIIETVISLRGVTRRRSEIIEVSIRVGGDEVVNTRHGVQTGTVASPSGIKAPGKLSFQSIYIGEIANGKHAARNGIEQSCSSLRIEEVVRSAPGNVTCSCKHHILCLSVEIACGQTDR